MFSIAHSFIKHKRKYTFMLFAIIFLAILLLFVLMLQFGTIIKEVDALNYSRYGRHHLILYDIDEETAAAVLADENYPVEQSGWITNFGSWEIEGTTRTLTLGYFDETAFSLGEIDLLEGRLPKHISEVAVEKAALYRFAPDAGLGSKMTFQKDGESKTVKVVGIIGDYSSRWNLPTDMLPGDLYKRGYTDLPQVFVAENLFPESYGVKDNIVYFSRSPFDENATFYEGFYNRVYENSAMQAMNDNNYVYAQQYVTAPFQKFEILFLVVAIFGCCLTIFVALRMYVIQYKDTYLSLYMLGAEGEFTFGTYLWQVFLIVCGVMLITAAFLIIFSILLKSFSAMISITSIHLPIASTPIFLTIFLALFLFWRMIMPLRGKAISSYKEETKISEMQIKKSFSFALYKSFVRVNWRKVLGAVMVIALLISTLAAAIPYLNYMKSLIFEEGDDVEDFTIFSNMAQFNMQYGFFDMAVEEADTPVIPLEDADKIYENQSVAYLQKGYHAVNMNLFLPQTSEYWAEWTKEYLFKYQDEFTLREQQFATLAAEKEEMSFLEEAKGIVGFSIVEINEHNKDAFIKEYPTLFSENGLNKGECVLFLPVIEEQEEEIPMINTVENEDINSEDPKQLTNDIFQKGMSLNLVGAKYIGESERDELWGAEIIPAEDIEVIWESLEISGVQNEMLDIEIDGLEIKRPYVTIVISTETYEGFSHIDGITRLAVHMKDGYTLDEYEATKKEVINLSYELPGGEILIKADESMQNKRFVETINRAILILFIVFGGFSCFTIYTVLYMAVIARMKSFSIYRALGMKKKNIWFALFGETFSYWLLGMLLSIVILFLISFYIPLFGIWTIQNVVKGFPIIGYASLAGIPLCLLLSGFLTRAIYKGSIVSHIGRAE